MNEFLRKYFGRHLHISITVLTIQRLYAPGRYSTKIGLFFCFCPLKQQTILNVQPISYQKKNLPDRSLTPICISDNRSETKPKFIP